MKSIRLRTAALVAVGLKVLLVLGGVALLLVLRAALTARFDDALAARAEALRSLARVERGQLGMDFAGEAMPRYATPPRGAMADEHIEYFVAWVRDQDAWRTLERSESLNDQSWPSDTLRDGATGIRNVALPTGKPGRGIVIDFTPIIEHDEGGKSRGEMAAALEPTAPPMRLLVAVSRAPLDRSLAAIGWSIAGVGFSLALASVLLVRWAVGRGLRPLTDFSRRVQSLGPDSLDVRFGLLGLPEELRPIAEQLNGLFARLAEAFEREKRFSAAASHELRTPIAELRMLLEVAANRPRTSEEWRRTSEQALGVLTRAHALCETLLRLSRAGTAHAAPRTQAQVKVDAVLAQQASLALSMHGRDARSLRLECDNVVIAGVDEATLASIVGNLIDNALRHGRATPDDPVVVHATAQAGTAFIRITNSAPDLADDDLSRMFEPFWRKDASRHDHQGFGLGLSVSRALARSIGGDIVAHRSGTRTLTLEVTIRAEPRTD